MAFPRCILSKFYIKPQQIRHLARRSGGCILSKFYIKPQLGLKEHKNVRVVSYRNSTSNHNYVWRGDDGTRLYLIEILHQTTTRGCARIRFSCCILSKFYIKPQLRIERELARCSCILSKFYIKPQQRVRHKLGHSCCILSKFYIKPQQIALVNNLRNVVSYRNSTSNHNKLCYEYFFVPLYLIEILHQTTTAC